MPRPARLVPDCCVYIEVIGYIFYGLSEGNSVTKDKSLFLDIINNGISPYTNKRRF